MPIKKIGITLVLGLVSIIITVMFIRNGGSFRPPVQTSKETEFNLYTRVTETTWPKIQPYSRPGDLFWGRVTGIPAPMRALTIPHYSALTSQLADNQSGQYSAVNLDGEYRDFSQALVEARQIREYIDAFNSKHQRDTGFIPLKFVAFYHLNIIDAHPEILNYPDVVLFGKSGWNSSNFDQVTAPYLKLIRDSGKSPVVLIGDIQKDIASRTQVKNTFKETLDNFHALIDSPPAGLGLKTIGYYYPDDDSENLLSVLSVLRVSY